jgi:hypothetical protein
MGENLLSPLRSLFCVWTLFLAFLCRAHFIWHVKEKLITLAWKFKRPSTLKKLSRLKRQSALHFFLCKIPGWNKLLNTLGRRQSLVWWGDRKIIWKEIKSALSQRKGFFYSPSRYFVKRVKKRRRPFWDFPVGIEARGAFYPFQCAQESLGMHIETNLIKMNNASCRKLAFFMQTLQQRRRSPFILAISPRGEREI